MHSALADIAYGKGTPDAKRGAMNSLISGVQELQKNGQVALSSADPRYSTQVAQTREKIGDVVKAAMASNGVGHVDGTSKISKGLAAAGVVGLGVSAGSAIAEASDALSKGDTLGAAAAGAGFAGSWAGAARGAALGARAFAAGPIPGLLGTIGGGIAGGLLGDTLGRGAVNSLRPGGTDNGGGNSWDGTMSGFPGMDAGPPSASQNPGPAQSPGPGPAVARDPSPNPGHAPGPGRSPASPVEVVNVPVPKTVEVPVPVPQIVAVPVPTPAPLNPQDEEDEENEEDRAPPDEPDGPVGRGWSSIQQEQTVEVAEAFGISIDREATVSDVGFELGNSWGGDDDNNSDNTNDNDTGGTGIDTGGGGEGWGGTEGYGGVDTSPGNDSGGYGGGDGDGGDEPVILDLTGQGLKVTPRDQSTVFYDMAGDGYKHRTAWAGIGNGVLAIDADGDGQITERNEVIFKDWDPSAGGDLQAIKSVFAAGWPRRRRRARVRTLRHGPGSARGAGAVEAGHAADPRSRGHPSRGSEHAIQSRNRTRASPSPDGGTRLAVSRGLT
jgi:hypothetical protein